MPPQSRFENGGTTTTTTTDRLPSSSSSSSLASCTPCEEDEEQTMKSTSSFVVEIENKNINKHVCFAEESLEEVVEILSHHDMNTEEKSDIWLNNDDLLLIFERIRADLVQLSLNKPRVEVTSRGLEWRMTGTLERRRENREYGVRTVLEEQYRQRRSMSEVDPERISLLYQLATEHCQVMANNIGLEDEMEADKVRNEYDTVQTDHTALTVKESTSSSDMPHYKESLVVSSLAAIVTSQPTLEMESS